MQMLISDANILIDLEDGELLKRFFELPYQFCVPDILFYEELDEQHAHLIDYGLKVLELTSASMAEVTSLVEKYSDPSRNDCFALMLAKQENCSLLTGDRYLKKAANREGVMVSGTIWVIENMVRCEIITISEAESSYEKMKLAGSRLPWKLAKEGLGALKEDAALAGKVTPSKRDITILESADRTS